LESNEALSESTKKYTEPYNRAKELKIKKEAKQLVLDELKRNGNGNLIAAQNMNTEEKIFKAHYGEIIQVLSNMFDEVHELTSDLKPDEVNLIEAQCHLKVVRKLVSDMIVDVEKQLKDIEMNGSCKQNLN